MTQKEDHDPAAVALVTGDRDECMNCGKRKGQHEGILNKCPGARYGYFKSKFNYDGELNHEYTDKPVCPWCGYVYTIDDEYHLYEEGGHDVECPDCERPFRSSCSISYSFSTERIDTKAEREKEEREKQRREDRRLERLAQCEPFTPGMRVRILSDNHRKRYNGRLATVENEELGKGNPFVHVLIDADPDDPESKPYSTFLNGDEIEKA